MQLLVKNGTVVKAKDNGGWTALHMAAKNGHEMVMRLLLENKADVKTENNGGWTALHSAARNGYKAVMRLLVFDMSHIVLRKACLIDCYQQERRWTGS
jgi:ankyrin repeat protein